MPLRKTASFLRKVSFQRHDLLSWKIFLLQVLSRGRIVTSGSQNARLALSDLNTTCAEPTTEQPTTVPPTTEEPTVVLDPAENTGSGVLNDTTQAPITRIFARRLPYFYPTYVPPPPCPCGCKRSCGLQIRVPITSEMGPRGRLVVHTTLPTKEVVVDSVNFDVTSLFDNKVCFPFRLKILLSMSILSYTCPSTSSHPDLLANE